VADAVLRNRSPMGRPGKEFPGNSLIIREVGFLSRLPLILGAISYCFHLSLAQDDGEFPKGRNRITGKRPCLVNGQGVPSGIRTPGHLVDVVIATYDKVGLLRSEIGTVCQSAYSRSSIFTNC
jgi:hypothetical protein